MGRRSLKGLYHNKPHPVGAPRGLSMSLTTRGVKKKDKKDSDRALDKAYQEDESRVSNWEKMYDPFTPEDIQDGYRQARKERREKHNALKRDLRVTLEFGAFVELGDQWVANGTNWVLRLPSRKVLHFAEKEDALMAWQNGYREIFQARASKS